MSLLAHAVVMVFVRSAFRPEELMDLCSPIFKINYMH